MTAINKIRFNNELTASKSKSLNRREPSPLDAAWLRKNEFCISGFWHPRVKLPESIELGMFVHADHRNYEDEAYIILANISSDAAGHPSKIRWLTEKQLVKEITILMDEACTGFADDFFPCALKIVIRAQKEAQKLVEKELKRRADIEEVD